MRMQDKLFYKRKIKPLVVNFPNILFASLGKFLDRVRGFLNY